MNIEDIYGLMDRFGQSGMSELKLEFEGVKLVCRKDAQGGKNMEYSAVNVDKTDVNKSIPAEKQESALKNDNVIEANTIEVRAKVAGTFYRAPSPESEPFVQVGQSVKKGDTIGMIEAMKMMNDIIAPEDGEVLSVAANNEQLVGYDEVLIILKKGE